MQRHGTDFMAAAVIAGGAVVGLGATMAFGGKHGHSHHHYHGHHHGKGHSHAVVCETTVTPSSDVAVKFWVRDQSGSVTEYRPPKDRRPVRKRKRCRRIVTDADHRVEFRLHADRLHFRTNWGDANHPRGHVDRERLRERAEMLRERAVEARERAAEARQRADAARERGEEALRRAREARERAVEARERGEEARERAEAARERAAGK